MNHLKNKVELIKYVSKIENEDEKALALLQYCCYNKVRKWKDCPDFATEALSLGLKLENKEYIGLAYLELGYQKWFSDSHKEAFNLLEKSQDFLSQTNNYFKYSRATAVKSSILWSRGKRKEAIAEVFNGLRHVSESKNKEDSLWLEWFLGIYYFDLKDYENCEKQYLKALDIIDNAKVNVRDAYAYCIIGCAGVLIQTDRKDLGYDFLQRGIKFSKKNELWMQEARGLNDLGNYCLSINQVEQAEIHYQEAYAIRKEQNTKPALVTTIISLAKIKMANDIDKSLELALVASQLSEEIDSKAKIIGSNELLAKIYERLNKPEKSQFHKDIAKKNGALISEDQLSAELKNLESQFITDLLKRESKILTAENAALTKANEIIKKQFKEISDSINYARRIQSAILPKAKLVNSYLDDSMIIYLPKDVVAGDFYWMENVGDIVLFALADCTGHGVPGAMISVICNNALNRAVREFNICKPSLLLDKVRELILLEFSSEDSFNDGMDISLCALDVKSKKMEWAGANSPLWIVRDGTQEVEEIKGDKQPIGNYPFMKTFTNHTVQLEENDCLYIFSDGFVDQFGGPKGKKYMKKAFKELVIKNSELPMSAQRTNLLTEFDNWKGEEEQIDDVCVIGYKV